MAFYEEINRKDIKKGKAATYTPNDANNVKSAEHEASWAAIRQHVN
jgi:hypothetical protein